jgi:hypothetical protein
MTGPTHVLNAAEPPTTYELRVAGHLDDRWSEWFGAHSLVRNADASSTLTVVVADQAHLHGVIAGVRDLGVTLLSLTRVEDVAPGESAEAPRPPAPAASGDPI